MTDLEKTIYEYALKILPKYELRAKEIKTSARYIEIPFYFDGVFDYLVYDTNNKKFTEIKYFKGVGVGTCVEGDSGASAYFDDIEICKIVLS